MPARRKRAGTYMRSRKPAANRAAALALDMEEPLNEALEAVHALRLMGYGLTQRSDDYEGRALAAIASTACHRLDALRQVWHSLCQVAARTSGA